MLLDITPFKHFLHGYLIGLGIVQDPIELLQLDSIGFGFRHGYLFYFDPTVLDAAGHNT